MPNHVGRTPAIAPLAAARSTADEGPLATERGALMESAVRYASVSFERIPVPVYMFSIRYDHAAKISARVSQHGAARAAEWIGAQGDELRVAVENQQGRAWPAWMVDGELAVGGGSRARPTRSRSRTIPTVATSTS